MPLWNYYIARRAVHPIFIILPAFFLIIPVTGLNFMPPIAQMLTVFGLIGLIFYVMFTQMMTGGNVNTILEAKGYPQLPLEDQKRFCQTHIHRLSGAIVLAQRYYFSTGDKTLLRALRKPVDVSALMDNLPAYEEVVLLPVWNEDELFESLMNLAGILAEEQLPDFTEAAKVLNLPTSEDVGEK